MPLITWSSRLRPLVLRLQRYRPLLIQPELSKPPQAALVLVALADAVLTVPLTQFTYVAVLTIPVIAKPLLAAPPSLQIGRLATIAPNLSKSLVAGQPSFIKTPTTAAFIPYSAKAIPT